MARKKAKPPRENNEEEVVSGTRRTSNRKRQRAAIGTVHDPIDADAGTIEIQDEDDNSGRESDGIVEINDNESLSSLQSAISSLASTGTSTNQKQKKVPPATPKKEDDNYRKILSNNNVDTPVQSNVVTKKKTSTTTKKSIDMNTNIMDEIDVIIPPSLLNNVSFTGGDCTLMIQVEPDDASVLEFHGASGAVGRFEANDQVVTMDLKGYQYSGTIHPGPTALVVSMHPMQSSSIIANGNTGPIMKVESITDEFVTMSKARDMMATLDAIVEKGDMDQSYFSKEINVNAKTRNINEDNQKEENGNKKKTTPTRKKTAHPTKAKKKIDSIKSSSNETKKSPKQK